LRTLTIVTCLGLGLASPGYSQTFEVASIKAVAPGAVVRSSIEPTPGNLVMRSVGMVQLITWAYKIGQVRVSNIELAMAVKDRFDITAKAAGPAKSDDLRLMLQALLAERFKLKVHFETKTVSAFALVEAKGGHKMTVSDAPDGNGVLPDNQPNRTALRAKNATLDQLTMFLSGPLRTPVLDMTGLKGRYDFELDVTTLLAQRPAPSEGEQSDPISILQLALPQQLGLKLESRKMPVEMLVIDHIEKTPTQN
jgi:uncharacterized protein (TIGR03435 family)